MAQTTNPFNPPVAQEPAMQEKTSNFSTAWYQWFSKVARALLAPVSSAAPASSVSAGVPGQICYDQNFLYVCIQANVWKRVALSAF